MLVGESLLIAYSFSLS